MADQKQQQTQQQQGNKNKGRISQPSSSSARTTSRMTSATQSSRSRMPTTTTTDSSAITSRNSTTTRINNDEQEMMNRNYRTRRQSSSYRQRENQTQNQSENQLLNINNHYHANRNNISNNSATAAVSQEATREFQRDNNNDNSSDDDEENRSTFMHLKNVVEEDESANGEIRPNKLFPVKNERDVLLRKVRSVLNKVSSVNYHRLRKRWLNLMPSGEGEEEDGPRLGIHQIGEVLQLVIAKALDDTIYMHIYAGLMGYVVGRKPPEIASKIRQLINAQLHHELQKLTTDKELALFDRSTQRVDAARRKKVTLHRFIAELYGEKACTSKFLYQRVTDLLIVNNPSDIDENVECLCVLMTFSGQKLEEVKKPWVEDIFTKLVQRQTETPSMISKRIQFMILDLVEMRASGWSPHNKWWSPSVQRAPVEVRRDEEDQQQLQQGQSQNLSWRSPASRSPNQQQQQNQEEPPMKLQRKQAGNNSNSSRSRTRSEGANSSSSGSLATTVPLTMMQMQEVQGGQGQHQQGKSPVVVTVRNKSELTPNQSRALMALLNKVSPYNLDRIAQQLYEVLNEETLDEAVNFIVDKILDDSFYTRTHASLINKVAYKPNMKSFGIKIASRIMRVLERNPDSKDGFHFLAELYNLRLISIHQVKTALEWLMNCSPGMINSAMESLVMFLFIAGAKLEADVRDELWMNRLIEFWEKKATLVAHNQGRPMCLLRDVIELRQNKWAPLRQPHWIPPTIDLPTIQFEPESLIRLFQSDRMEFLRFVKGETSSLSRIERFSKEALQYAVRHGNWERDPEFLKMTGVCLRVLIHERLLRRGRLENYLGTFVSEVIAMRRRNAKAWDNLGIVMNEVY